MNCKIIRSNRKSLGLEVNTDGLIIRAPLQASDAEINMFILQHKDWIEKNLNRAEERQKTVDSIQPLSMDEIKDLANKALKVIPERVKYYAPKVGVNYGRITIRNQRSKWGSCSGKGNLNFKKPLNKPYAAERRIFCPSRAVPKTGNTYSIPPFPELSPEPKSSAVSSCRFNQSFLNCLLMLAPPEVLDSVVVHELIHDTLFSYSQTDT